MTSKSLAPRPSDGKSTVGGPSPCVKTCRRASARVTIMYLIIAELEQPPRIGAADLDAVILADRAGVEPKGGVIDILERPVGREHDPVAADFGERVHQRGRMELAGSRDMEIGAEIFAHALLGRIIVPVRNPGIGIVDAPQRERQVLAHMAENDLQPRMRIEQA